MEARTDAASFANCLLRDGQSNLSQPGKVLTPISRIRNDLTTEVGDAILPALFLGLPPALPHPAHTLGSGHCSLADRWSAHATHPEKLVKLESEMQRLAAMERSMLASPDQQISLTDPDVRRSLSIAFR